jgi:hypothetical protein
MINYDSFTKKYIKIFINKRDKNIKFDFINKEKDNILKQYNKNIDFKIEKYEIPSSKIKKLFDTEWVYNEAINNLDILTANYKITWFYKSNHTIFFKGSEDKFNLFKQRLNVLINILNYIIDKSNQNKIIKMYLILTPLKKTLENTTIIGPININSGYTDFMVNEILCWREEEFEKVIFHEMIHYMDLDVRNMAFDDTILPHKIDGHKSYFEAFTDFWGILYHIIYLSIILKKSPNSLLEIEYEFIKNQSHLINDFFKLDDWTTKKHLTQKSPAFSYFILKYLIFKKIIYSNNIKLLDNPRELLIEIMSEKYNQESYVKLAPRMTLLQLN